MGEFEKRKIRGSYDNLGGRIYDLRYELEQISKYEKILDHVKLNSDEIVLDVGCGTGLFLQRLEVQGVGLDFSPELVSTARSGLRKTVTSLVLSDAEVLPFRSHVFDVVFAVTLIQNMPDPEKALKEMERVVHENSTIIITALKKTFTLELFRQLILNSNLKIKCITEDDALMDWIAFTNSLSSQTMNV